MDRRAFTASLVVAGAASVARPAFAVPSPAALDDAPPMGSRDEFIGWGVTKRGEGPIFLGERFDRFRTLVGSKDIKDYKDKRAFLMTPREDFVLKRNLGRAYEHAFLDIGFGVTIAGPTIIGRMIQAIDVKPGDKVLEIGTGSGYQSAYLANLTDKVWTIEIIKPLAERTAGVRDALIETGYTAYEAINWTNADGYHGWEPAAPFDQIIVTCGVDHVPPPLLRQLKGGGAMVMPVGPPGAQRVLKIVKQRGEDGRVTVTDIYNGRIVPFVPFTKLAEDGQIEGTHNQ